MTRTSSRRARRLTVHPAILFARRVPLIAVGYAVGLFAITASLGSTVSAAETIPGSSGVADGHMVMNFKGTAKFARQYGLTSSVPVETHPPYPIPYLLEGGAGGGTPGSFPAAAPDEREDGGSGGAALSPPPAQSFRALSDNGLVIPPDTHGAVGPNHLLVTLNSEVQVQDRSGNVLSVLSLNLFWSGLGGFNNAFDPKALYDPQADRFIVTAMANARSGASAVLLAVSQTGDPTGNWNLYSVDADPLNQAWADYPSIGLNKDWITVSVNMFPIFGSAFRGVNIYVFNKADVYAGGAGLFRLIRETTQNSFTMVPSVSFDTNSSTMHLVEVNGLLQNYTNRSSVLRISTITGNVGQEVLNIGTALVVSTNFWNSSEPIFRGSSPQLGSPRGIANNDSRIQNLVYRNGSLWAAHTVFRSSGTTNRSSIQWWQLAPDGSVLQNGTIDDPSGRSFYAFPSIGVNRRDDVLIGYTRFSATQYASANYSFRFGTDPPNTMQRDFVLKAGETTYVKDFGSGNRWGDYSATMVDPVNDLDLWTIQEYAASPINQWGTWWGKVDVANTPPFRTEFTSDIYQVAENAGSIDITVVNIGGAAGTVDYLISDGTAVRGTDYTAPVMGTLTFAAGQLTNSFPIILGDNGVVNSNRTINLALTNATGGLLLGFTTNAVVEIIDDEAISLEGVVKAGEFNFSSYVAGGFPYFVSEYESTIAPCGNNIYTFFTPERRAFGALITVVRTNGAAGRVMVDYATEDGGTAIPFLDYIPVSGTMVFDDYQMSTNFLITVFPSLLSTNSLTNLFSFSTVRLVLSDPRPAPEEEAIQPGVIRPTLGLGSESALNIYDIDPFPSGAYSFEHLWKRTDEYPSANAVGGVRTINIQVLGLPGAVDFVVPNLVDGFILQPGSDYAEADGARVLANPRYNDPSLGTITNFSDHVDNRVTLTFTAQICRRNVALVITNDSTVEFNEDIIIILERNGNNPPPHPLADVCNVTVMFDDQPAGAADREWNPAGISQTDPAFNLSPGANNTVTALAVQSDGKTLLGGQFTHVNAEFRPRIARMNTDGSLDLGFVVGNGADDAVTALAVYPTNSPNADRILMVGNFNSYNGTLTKGIARIFANGALDTSFSPGTGANGPIRAVAIQADGKIIIAGGFTEVHDESRNRVARLNPDGSLDQTFNPGFGADGDIWAIGLVPGPLGETVLLGGDFLFFNDEFNRGLVALAPNGSLDPLFDTGSGFDGPVYAIAIQANGQILAAGDFTSIDDRVRISVARLNANGSLDPTWDTGRGADGPVNAITIQSDGKALIGGQFQDFNGTRRMGLARLRRDGTLDTSFLDTGYNQFAGLIKEFDFAPANFVSAIALQQDGKVMIGGSFTNIGGNQSIRHSLRNPYTVFTRSDKVPRQNIARLIGEETPGPGNAEFDRPQYFVDEHGSVASIRLQRIDGRLGSLVAEATTTDRFATNGLDYTNTTFANTWDEGVFAFAPISVGEVSPVFFRIPIIDDKLQEGDEIIDLSFLRPGGSVNLWGEWIPLGGALGLDSAQLTIADNDFDPGIFNFSLSGYTTNENAAFAIVTVIRTNGSAGAVSVDFMTVTNVDRAAQVGSDYVRTNGTLNFAAGQTNRSFLIRLLDDINVENDENIGLILTNATGGARLPGLSPLSTVGAIFTLVDNDSPPGRINFLSASFTTNESAGAAVITVSRNGGNVGVVSVNFATADGTATAFSDYLPTNGVLSWNDGESGARTFTIPLLADNLVEPVQTVVLTLSGGAEGLLGDITNAVLNIVDSDAYGELSFNQGFYQADENSGQVAITVARKNGIAGMVSVDFATISGGARPGIDYVPTNGTLVLLPGESSKTFFVPILDDSPPDSDGNQCLTLVLSNAVNATLVSPSVVTLSIIDNEAFNLPPGRADSTYLISAQANDAIHAMVLGPTLNSVTNCLQTTVESSNKLYIAGDFTEVNNATRSHVARLQPDGTLDPSFDPGLGPNASIRALSLLPDGKLLIGGFFTDYQATNRNSIARLNQDGSLDSFFNPGAGADNPVYALALQPDLKIIVGGAFSSFNGNNRPGVVRLNTNGTVDISFAVGSGANGPVYAVAVQRDGKILVAGDFTAFNGQPRNRLVRLNPNGSLDPTFLAVPGMNAAVRTLLVQPDGRIVAGGSFTTVNGIARNYLARLLPDGSVDPSFLPAPLQGADNAVYALAQQIDGRLIVGGDFRRFNNVTRNRLTRLNADGSVDPTINFGTGANSFVAAVQIQPDRKIVFGGGFTSYDDEPRGRIARIHGGSVAGAGTIEFASKQFLVNEDGTNALITVRRRGGTTGTVTVNYRTAGGTALPISDYTPVSGTLTFPNAETQQSFLVPIRDDSVPNPDWTVLLELIPGSYTGGATAGPQATSTLVILNDEAILEFDFATDNENENVPGGQASVSIRRVGGTNRTASVTVSTTTGGTATPFFDFIPTSTTLVFLPGQLTRNFLFPLINDTNIEGNETIQLVLSAPSGSNVVGLGSSTLTLVDDDFGPGQFVFSSLDYTTNEAGTLVNALITILRTNGTRNVASVRFSTQDGTATAGQDYAHTNVVVSFADNETMKVVEVPILPDIAVEPAETVRLILSEPTGQATLGAFSNAVLNILDDDVNLIVAAGSTLIAESIQPPNQAIDPGETVTLQLALRNVGTSDTGPIRATVLPNAGVVNPDGPRDYGSLIANGPAVSMPFTFTAFGSNGTRLLVTLLLTSNGETNGFATFSFTLAGQASTVFTNSTPITLIDNSAASPYPSTITVANIGGTLRRVTATLINVSHTYPDDIDVLLVSPTGARVTLMSDVGGGRPLSNVTLTFAANATNQLPDSLQIVSGTYLPTNPGGTNTADFFPPPAPGVPYTNVDLTVFNDQTPNGVWSLYAVDDSGRDNGIINGGWSLTIETADPVVPAADLGLGAGGAGGSVVLGQDIVCTFSVTNFGPATASNVVVRETLPAGLDFVSATTSRGNYTYANKQLTWNVGTLPNGGRASVTMTATAMQLGTATSVANVTSPQPDFNQADNSVSMVLTVIEQPVLSVSRLGDNLIFSWPAQPGLVIESSPSLSAPNWQPVTAATVVLNGRIHLTVSPTSAQRYYRLRPQ